MLLDGTAAAARGVPGARRRRDPPPSPLNLSAVLQTREPSPSQLQLIVRVIRIRVRVIVPQVWRQRILGPQLRLPRGAAAAGAGAGVPPPGRRLHRKARQGAEGGHVELQLVHALLRLAHNHMKLAIGAAHEAQLGTAGRGRACLRAVAAVAKGLADEGHLRRGAAGWSGEGSPAAAEFGASGRGQRREAGGRGGSSAAGAARTQPRIEKA